MSNEPTSNDSENVRPLVSELVGRFTDRFGATGGVVVAGAPGRVNLIGDHTDYNDGWVLPITIDRSTYAAVRPRRDDRIVVRSVDFDDELSVSLAGDPVFEPGSWKSYVTGAVKLLSATDRLDTGFEMAIAGDVPIGAGLSSSASLEIAVLQALDAAFDLQLPALKAVRLGQTIEHEFAGVECGIMDQFVVRLGARGHAMLLDCRSLDFEHVAFSPAKVGLALLIADTRVKRELASSKYAERRTECREAAARLRTVAPTLDSLRDADRSMLENGRKHLGETLYRRALHVVEENRRVVDAGRALRSGEYEAFGALMTSSHASLRDLYEVSCRELDLLVHAAGQSSEVLGARMTGGGFGGCAVILARAGAVSSLKDVLERKYVTSFGRPPAFYVVADNHRTEVYRSVER